MQYGSEDYLIDDKFAFDDPERDYPFVKGDTSKFAAGQPLMVA
jgi:hypothetical protein